MLTLLIPTKNHGIYLEHLLSNVVFAAQSPVTQLLICNDGSTDDTAAILAKYSGDKRIRVFENTTSVGAMRAFELMYPHIETPYFMLLASDDLFYPEQLRKVYDETVRRKAAMGFGKYRILEGEQQTDLNHPGWEARHFKDGCDFEALLGFDHYAFLIILHKESMPKHGANQFLFDLSLNELAKYDGLGELRAQDWNLALEISIAHPDRVYFMNEYCGCFRKVANQMSSENVYVHTGRAVFEMAILILRHLSDYKLRQRIKAEPQFHAAVKNLFYTKFGQVTEAGKESTNFLEIYKPMIIAADTLLNNM